MSRLTVATRWFRTGTSPADVAVQLERWRVHEVLLDVPGPLRLTSRADARTAGCEVAAVALRDGPGAAAEDPGAFLSALRPAAAAAAATRAGALVVEGGETGNGLVVREAAAERAVRALHDALRWGAPVAIRNGGRASDVLGFEETEWVLEALPRLGLYLDPARALGLADQALGPPVDAWVERFAPRVGGTFLHGLGSEGAGGRHPEDHGPDWPALVESLPRAAPRVLDLDPSLESSEVEDAVRYARLLPGAGAV